MMRNISCALIIPAAHLAEINAIAESLEHGPDNISVPLSADGHEPATHYGCHTWCDADFLALLADPPAELAGSPALATLAAHHVVDGDPLETFDAALGDAGLVRVGDV